jgi:hypothetical protein
MKLVQIIILFLLYSCGCNEPTQDVRDYHFSISGHTEEVTYLINQFNLNAGYTIFKLDGKPNSFIYFTDGLAKRDGVIGWGTSVRVIYLTHVEWTGEIELDEGWFSSSSTYDQEKLFDHEAGHVLGFGHEADPGDMMYAYVDTDKNFEQFFYRVRQLWEAGSKDGQD